MRLECTHRWYGIIVCTYTPLGTPAARTSLLLPACRMEPLSFVLECLCWTPGRERRGQLDQVVRDRGFSLAGQLLYVQVSAKVRKFETSRHCGQANVRGEMRGKAAIAMYTIYQNTIHVGWVG